MCTELALTRTASGATRTALSSLHSQDGDPNIIARDVIVAPQGAAVSFGQPDGNGDIPIDISTPDPTSPPVVQTTTIVNASTSFSSFFTIVPIVTPVPG